MVEYYRIGGRLVPQESLGDIFGQGLTSSFINSAESKKKDDAAMERLMLQQMMYQQREKLRQQGAEKTALAKLFSQGKIETPDMTRKALPIGSGETLPQSIPVAQQVIPQELAGQQVLPKDESQLAKILKEQLEKKLYEGKTKEEFTANKVVAGEKRTQEKHEKSMNNTGLDKSMFKEYNKFLQEASESEEKPSREKIEQKLKELRDAGVINNETATALWKVWKDKFEIENKQGRFGNVINNINDYQNEGFLTKKLRSILGE